MLTGKVNEFVRCFEALRCQIESQPSQHLHKMNLGMISLCLFIFLQVLQFPPILQKHAHRLIGFPRQRLQCICEIDCEQHWGQGLMGMDIFSVEPCGKCW